MKVEKYSDFSFIILAGGKSRRMGQPKHMLLYKGKTFAEILANISMEMGFGETIFSGLIASDLPEHIVKSSSFVADELPDRGPLGGLHACLKSAKYRSAIVVPIDCPFITKSLISDLISSHKNSSVDVTLTKRGEKTEPLIGVYNRAVHETIFTVIEHSSAPVFRALDKTTYDVFNYEGDPSAIVNINTKDDYSTFV